MIETDVPMDKYCVVASGIDAAIDLSPMQLNVHFLEIGELCPAEDITPLEAVHIQMLLAVSSVRSYRPVDYAGFVKKHHLERHFLSAATPGEKQ